MKKIISVFFLLFTFFMYGQKEQPKSVGINTTSPKATLDVEGNVKIENVPTTEKTDLSLLFRNNTTKILSAAKGSKTIYKLRYKIYTDEKDAANISSYDTKIPYDNYYVIPIHSIFKVEDTDGSGNKRVIIPPLPPLYKSEYDNHPDLYFANKKMQLLKNTTNKSSTWSLRLKYPRTYFNLNKGQKGFWEVTLLILDRRYIEENSPTWQEVRPLQ